MTSIATVKASGDCTSRYDSYLELSPPCGVVKRSKTKLNKCIQEHGLQRSMHFNETCLLRPIFC